MTKNGSAARIVRYVTANPGCTRADIVAACGVVDDHRWAMPTYCIARKLIFSAGPRGSQRYFPTIEQARAAHDRICADVKAANIARVKAWHLKQNLKRIAKRQAAGAVSHPSLRRFKLDPGTTLAPDFKVTVAPAPRDRWSA